MLGSFFAAAWFCFFKQDRRSFSSLFLSVGAATFARTNQAWKLKKILALSGFEPRLLLLRTREWTELCYFEKWVWLISRTTVPAAKWSHGHNEFHLLTLFHTKFNLGVILVHANVFEWLWSLLGCIVYQILTVFLSYHRPCINMRVNKLLRK